MPDCMPAIRRPSSQNEKQPMRSGIGQVRRAPVAGSRRSTEGR